MASSDPFDDVLNLEDKFYSEGYEQGVVDGERAGRIEGRSFGIEKGFEKFVEAGRLYGKSIVWANRLPSQASSSSATKSTQDEDGQAGPKQSADLPRLIGGGGGRLEKNIVTLHALVEPDTLSTENTDDAVNEFDDRVKRAQGKARVLERQLGEDSHATTKQQKREENGAQVTEGAKRGHGVREEDSQQQQQTPSSHTEDALGSF